MPVFEIAVLVLLGWIAFQVTALRQDLPPRRARIPAPARKHDRVGDPWCCCDECYVTNPDGTVTHRSMLPETDPRRRPAAAQQERG